MCNGPRWFVVDNEELELLFVGLVGMLETQPEVSVRKRFTYGSRNLQALKGVDPLVSLLIWLACVSYSLLL